MEKGCGDKLVNFLSWVGAPQKGATRCPDDNDVGLVWVHLYWRWAKYWTLIFGRWKLDDTMGKCPLQVLSLGEQDWGKACLKWPIPSNLKWDGWFQSVNLYNHSHSTLFKTFCVGKEKGNAGLQKIVSCKQESFLLFVTQQINHLFSVQLRALHEGRTALTICS